MTERRVALIFGDRVTNARLCEAFRGFATVWATDHVASVVDAVSREQPVCASVILFSPTRREEALRAADLLRLAHPDHPVIGYVDPRTLSSRFILETGKANLADLVLRDVDDSRAVLLRVIQNAEQRGVGMRIADEMSVGLPRTVRVTLQFIFRHLREPLDVPSVAAGLGVNRRTLHHRLGQAGSPSVSELVGWCRVMFIAHQLATANPSLASIASQLDVPSWRNLNHLLRRYLGAGARQLRTPGAYSQAMVTFRGACTGHSAPATDWSSAQDETDALLNVNSGM